MIDFKMRALRLQNSAKAPQQYDYPADEARDECCEQREEQASSYFPV
jgi:hypothetical protein